MSDNEMRMKGKLNYFLDKRVRVHIKRVDRQFWNGLIIEKESDDVYILKEDKLGLVHLFVCDVYDVEENREAKRDALC